MELVVKEMSATMDANIMDRQKTLFSYVKTLAVDPKQQRAPTSILKLGTKTDVGNVVMPPASLPPGMVSNEKPFQHPPLTQHGHPASGRSSAADLDERHENKQTTRDSHKAKGDINLGLYDCLDNASDDLAFSGSILDDNGNPLKAETVTQPPDRSGTCAAAHIGSQDTHCQLQDTASLSNGCNNNAIMGSTGFGGKSSNNSSSDSSSGRDSACRSVSSHRHRRHKQHHS
jgi:hypothetical protein